MDTVQNQYSSPPLKSRFSGNGDFPLKKTFIFSGIVFAFILFWTWVSSPMYVTITGVGEVAVPAESATITFALTASDQSAVNATSMVKAKADNFRIMLRNSGISEGEIVESQVEVIPSVEGEVFAYQAVITMAAKTIHVSSVSGLVASLYSSGATLVSQPVVSVEEQDELKQRAFSEAMKDANQQARQFARKNWKLVKKIVNVSQISSGNTSTTTSKADILTEIEDQISSQNDVFKIIQAASVTYKMW